MSAFGTKEFLLKEVKMRFGRQLRRQKLLIALIFLAIMLSANYTWASSSDKKLSIFLAGGRSYPVGQFDHEVRVGYNWGGGVELRFPSNWAMGIVIHRAEFEHQRVYYSSRLRSWGGIDWTFIRGNWYGKHFFRKADLSPFFKTGLGIYRLEGKNTYAGWNSRVSRTTAYSIVPGAGLEYSKKRVSVFMEIDYNFVFRESTGGCVQRTDIRQFFDLFLGIGYFIADF